MDIAEKILSRKEFESTPPVLIDIGASGELHARWKKFASHAVCIAFDADDREMAFTEKESGTFKKLMVFSRVVTDQPVGEIDFFLTHSPFCSSSLEPDLNSLKNWTFYNHFEVEKKIKLKAIRLVDALKEAKIDRIDWFKTDSQGTDLRLFANLPEEIRKGVIAAEFEPGIIDAYTGEDKLHNVMQFMDGQGFFMSSIDVKSAQRLGHDELKHFSAFQRKALSKSLRQAPGWAEVRYLNGLKKGPYNTRAYLLAFLFAFIEEQFGFAMEVAQAGKMATQDTIFDELHGIAVRKIKNKSRYWPLAMIKRAGHKILSYL